MLVEEIMTSEPLTVETNQSIREALSTMHDADIRHLPVVSEGVLIGMLSDRDLKEFTLPLDRELDTGGDPFSRLETRLGDIVQGDVLSVPPSAEVSEVIDLMVEHKVGAIPVTNATDGALVGIVSYIDVLQAAQDIL
ncbi:MAG: CBS domain-containing protein [Bdellovibrionales bacterium]|nr:CBS domain-containing protein [Bdellovibrionales bacterium]